MQSTNKILQNVNYYLPFQMNCRFVHPAVIPICNSYNQADIFVVSGQRVELNNQFCISKVKVTVRGKR